MSKNQMDALLSILISDDVEKMRELLAKDDCDVINYTFPGGSKSIHMAQSHGMVCLLMEYGSDPESRDIGDRTPLFYWIMDGNTDLISYGIEELCINLDATDIDGKDCLHYVSHMFDDNIRELIEEARRPTTLI